MPPAKRIDWNDEQLADQLIRASHQIQAVDGYSINSVLACREAAHRLKQGIRLEIQGDRDTFDNVFSHLARGYTIAVNGADMVCFNTYDEDGDSALVGYEFDEETGEACTDKPVVSVKWEDIESVTIY